MEWWLRERWRFRVLISPSLLYYQMGRCTAETRTTPVANLTSTGTIVKKIATVSFRFLMRLVLLLGLTSHYPWRIIGPIWWSPYDLTVEWSICSKSVTHIQWLYHKIFHLSDLYNCLEKGLHGPRTRQRSKGVCYNEMRLLSTIITSCGMGKTLVSMQREVLEWWLHFSGRGHEDEWETHDDIGEKLKTNETHW